MEIEQQKTEQMLTLFIKGEIDKETSSSLENYVISVLDDAQDFVLNFKEVAYISSACLRVLLALQKKINTLGKTMKITNSNNTVKEIFNMSGFAKYIKIE